MKRIIAAFCSVIIVFILSACASGRTKVSEAPAEPETMTAATEITTAALQETREGDGSDMSEATQYIYELTENESLFIEKTVFDEDIIIRGDYGQITFAYCDFNANIINEAKEGTRVWIGEGNIFKNGCKCIFRNSIKEATGEYDLPKFMSWIPTNVVCEDCIGAATALNGVEVNFNGESFRIEDAALYMDAEHPENGMVPYDGQENANFLYVGKWMENGEPQTLVLCEHIPM